MQQLREKRREKRAAVLVKQDDEVTVKLENAALEHSKAVDSAVLGKYSIWRKSLSWLKSYRSSLKKVSMR